MEELKKQYLEIQEIADRIESLRCELWQSEAHKECADEEDFRYVDDSLFSLQHQLRLVSEYCLLNVF